MGKATPEGLTDHVGIITGEQHMHRAAGRGVFSKTSDYTQPQSEIFTCLKNNPFSTVLSQLKMIFLTIHALFFFNSFEANDWHSVGLTEHLKTEISSSDTETSLCSSIPFMISHLALAAIFSTTRSPESVCNAKGASQWVFRWGSLT